ncbi:MAG: DUF721 domain-containing protein [Pyrinomonadaceae bacterium]
MEQLFGAIPTVLNGLGPNAEIEEAVVFAAWPRCAGELLEQRTAPLEFFENRLVIAVQDETWRRHLEDLSPQMLIKLNRSLGQGTVKFIEFRIDESAIETKRDPTPNHVINAKKKQSVAPSLAKAAMAIDDEKLREQFLSAAAGYLAKQRKTLRI